ncbi:MAG TPA: TonB-dependent receptor [Stellaceae bacterium]|nr:TonB-dependent receptor [Stellaceae bacterium]
MSKNLVASIMLGLVAAGAHAADQPQQADAAAEAADSGTDETVIVRAVPVEEDVLPTRRNFNSVYGLDLNVLDTPRNVTVVSTTQLDAIEVRDPRDFSQLTSSSYTDSSFGSPNVPRIRGQFADLFYDGMRNSFVTDGNGAPLSFNGVESVNIIKGPASVAFGAGAGVGGAVDLIAKYPRFNEFSGTAGVEFDTEEERRWTLDIGGPLVDQKLAFRLSYTGEDSGSYYVNLYDQQHAVYGALAFRPTDDYTIDLQAEGLTAHYPENVGINRVNQALIDNGTYLRGAPIDSIITFDPSNPIPVGSPGNPFSPVTGILTRFLLGNPTQINRAITLDATPGTGGDAVEFHTNLIQTVRLGDDATFVNNTFFNYDDRDKIGYYYYANSFSDNYSVENRSEFKFGLPISLGPDLSFKSDIDAGFSFRFAHVKAITNFNNEPAGVYDLTTDPNLWRFADSEQFGAFQYISAFGKTLWGVPGRDGTNGGDTNESDTYDLAAFFQQRIEFDPRLSFLYGGRLDFIRADISDPLGGPVYNGLPQSASTTWHPLPNFNLSPVFKITPDISTYFTYNYSENLNGGGANGGVWIYGKTIDQVFHQASELFEAGVKAKLLDESLFADASIFRQTKAVPIGAASTQTADATIKGIEAELNYQPDRHFYATASYSYITTTLNQPAGFYNYPAEPGVNIDGAALFAVFKSGQTFKDPGVPEHLFNFLADYKFDNGIGLDLGLQVTGPIDTTTSGWLDLQQSLFVPASIVAKGGYYQSPQIPWQYSINAAVSYTVGNWQAKVEVFNLTDQKNWLAANPFYGNDFLIADEPIRAAFSVRYKF